MSTLKKKMNRIIFESDTKNGKLFDVILLIAIILSVLTVTLESVKYIEFKYSRIITIIEWTFTIIFSIEYFLRIYSSEKRLKYCFSFFGIIDFIAVVPTWLALFSLGTHYIIVVRLFRLLRVFRILKLARFLGEADILMRALKNSRYKITVFIGAVATFVVILGTLMYIVEGEINGFTSIPKGIYWAIITLTTVGFGDIVPQTILGQAISSFVMILGYGIIAIPTGIVTSETIKEAKKTGKCDSCGKTGLDKDSVFCKYCGKKLEN